MKLERGSLPTEGIVTAGLDIPRTLQRNREVRSSLHLGGGGRECVGPGLARKLEVVTGKKQYIPCLQGRFCGLPQHPKTTALKNHFVIIGTNQQFIVTVNKR